MANGRKIDTSHKNDRRKKWVIVFDHFEQWRAKEISSWIIKIRSLSTSLVQIPEERHRLCVELADAIGLILCVHSPEQHGELFSSIQSFKNLKALIIAGYYTRYEHMRPLFASLSTKVFKPCEIFDLLGIVMEVSSSDQI